MKRNLDHNLHRNQQQQITHPLELLSQRQRRVEFSANYCGYFLSLTLVRRCYKIWFFLRKKNKKKYFLFWGSVFFFFCVVFFVFGGVGKKESFFFFFFTPKTKKFEKKNKLA